MLINGKLTKAMILAAGYGTRLNPLTLHTPKALIKYKGVPLIEHVIKKLIFSGIEEIVVNTHYLTEQVEEYFNKNDFGIKINLSFEKEILGTGGGIKNASGYFHVTPPFKCLSPNDLIGEEKPCAQMNESRNGDSKKDFFLVHNADVISNIDIKKMFSSHILSGAFVTLAVNERKTSRPLLFDSDNHLAGRIINNDIFRNRLVQDENKQFDTIPKAFCGVHIVSTEIFDLFPEENIFDIISFYMDICNIRNITFYDIGNSGWKDMGKIEDFS